ncbi:MAG: hypothetical protein ACREBC_38050, partial [Pyrinomonadaceae bacterium]
LEFMQKRSSKAKKVTRKDTNTLAFSIVEQATGEAKKLDVPEKNPAAVALGRLGGLKGGKARAQKLSPKERAMVAKKAALARWKRR